MVNRSELFHTAITKPSEVIVNGFFSLLSVSFFLFQCSKEHVQWLEQYRTGVQDVNQMVLTLGLIHTLQDPGEKSCRAGLL